MADLLAGQQRADDVDALAQPGVAELLARPDVPGDVLVHRLAGAEGDPEPAGEHRAEGGDRLGDDHRVVPLAGGVDRAERQAGGGQRRAQPGPGEPGVALPGGPRLNMVRAHGGIESCLFRVLDVLEQLGGTDLFV